MAQPRPWIREIIEVLLDLGGEGSLNAIYEEISQRKLMDFSSTTWRNTVRRTIEEYSSDTTYFHTRKKTTEDDIFYAPKGLGEGYWAIREILS